jgi:Ser/Thr protein kinase RdoA (MazF antagonist)
VGEQWPRVARLEPASLIESVHAHSDLRLRLVGSLPGGEVGAALVVLPSGDTAVLSMWPGALGARAPAVEEILRTLRSRGYPAPAYLAVVDCGPVTAVVQERVEGTPVGAVTTGLVRSLLDLNRLQRDALPVAGGSLADLYLDREGPGYCLHEPMRRHDRRTAALLERVHHVARVVPADAVRGHDAVHGDFHPGNVLVAASSADRVAGVIDWTGARAGDCGLDLVTLAFFLDAAGAPARARAAVRERIGTDVRPAAALAFAAHLALRQVDWMVRHHGQPEVERWSEVAERWLTWASRRRPG